MSVKRLQITVQITDPVHRTLTLDDIPPEISVRGLIRLILERAGVPVTEDWELLFRGIGLPSGASLRDVVPLDTESITLTLTRETPTMMPAPASRVPAPAAPPAPAVPPAATTFDDEAFESDFDACESGRQVVSLDDDSGDSELRSKADDSFFEDAEDAPMPSASASPARSALPLGAPAAGAGTQRKPAQRRATVRYYTRMNPERVYPLLVMITRGMVEKVRKQDVGQKVSKAFEMDTESPLEIEPILPGCDCYPPRMSVRIGQGDLTATFRVVPRVLGTLDGVAVTIRQDHEELASIPLEVKVVQRTWVLCSGAMTFLLPAASAVFKHFGIDFTAGKGQGFSPYLAAVSLIFDTFPPAVLTGLLGMVTGAFWWFTRPKTRDTFWDIEKVGPAEKLKRIQKALTEDTANDEAAQELLDLLKAFPDFQPARLFYAEWHFDTGNFRAAFKGYERGLKLGRGRARDYHLAALSASRLGENQRALQFLEEAERLLPAREITGPMLYNMGCYHTRLGNPNRAIECLRRAIAAGFAKLESFQTDPDLAPLRSRPDFQKLTAALAKR